MATKFIHIGKFNRRAILQDNRHTLCGKLVNRWSTVEPLDMSRATCTRCVAEALSREALTGAQNDD